MGCACANWRAVFVAPPALAAGAEPVPSFVAFVDGDCYARMSRVQRLAAYPWQTLHTHDFENHPAGTRPHTTLPLDWLILMLAGLLRLTGEKAAALDVAGAWVSPLLGVATMFFLWIWSRWEQLRFRWAMLGFLAVNPMLAHGFALGRPDHQSLELFTLAVALAAEISLWQQPAPGWAFLAGAAWAIAIWTSLYEPLVLLAAVALANALFAPAKFWQGERLWGWALGSGILLLALALEGVRVDAPGTGENAALFAAWSRQIGELMSLAPWSPALFHWASWLLPAAPCLLVWTWRRGAAISVEQRPGKLALALALWLLLVWALTCWQVRWAYFLALVMALSLPWQFQALFGAVWIRLAATLATVVWLLALLPMLGECRQRLDTLRHGSEANFAAARAAESLREVAQFLRRENTASPSAPRGILAPWWESPPLAYWSGLPAVGGSSHESLSGNADVARFFLLPAREAAAAKMLLRARQVRWVVADDPERVLPLAAELLQLSLSRLSQPTLGGLLASDPLAAPPFLRLAFANPDLKVYAVAEAVFTDSSLPPPP